MALKNERFVYLARNFQTGLTDVTAKVRRNGTEVATGVALTEIGNGRYELLLTPVLLAGYGGEGLYDVYINSAATANSAPAVASRYISANNETDLETHLGTIESKIDVIDSNVDDIKSEVQHGTWGLSQLKNLIDSIQSSVSNIQNVTRFVAAVPSEMTQSDGSVTHYVIPMRIYDTTGDLEDPDSNAVAVSIVDEAGNDRTAYLEGYVGGPVNATRTAKGVYSIGLDIPISADAEQLIFTFAYAEGGVALSAVRTTNVISDIANAGYALESTAQATLTQVNTIASDIQDDVLPAVQDIQALVNDANFGLSALKLLIDAVDLKSVNIKAELDHATYGLSALKTALNTKASQASVDAVQTSATGIQTDLTDNVKGSGFNNGTDSLRQISLRVYNGGQVL